MLSLENPLVMGILNITQDSFYDGGRFQNEETQLKQVELMLKEGADIIDIGAMSSRPGAKISNPAASIKQLCPLIENILNTFPNTILSIDTLHATVAEACIQAGAHIINDISAGVYDKNIISAIAKYKNVPYIIMHMKGTPETMQQRTSYRNLNVEITDYFIERLAVCKDAGIFDVIIDPGIGFSKTTQQNFQLINRLQEFKFLDHPLLVGLSRKSLIWKTLKTSSGESLNGTSVLNTVALLNGANILRVHDVKQAKETITLVQNLKTPV